MTPPLHLQPRAFSRSLKDKLGTDRNAPMVILSNNQWKCDGNCPKWEAVGADCSAECRVKGLLRAYRQIGPDLMGLQEVSRRMADLLMAGLEKTTLADGSVARYEYLSGGDTPIVFRRDKLLLLESGFFRFPEEIPGLSGSFNNSETKSFCWGVFENRADKSRFAALSAHLWWMSSRVRPGSAEARAWQIRQAALKMDEVMGRYGCPGFMMGDFNAAIGSPCLETAFSLGWRETHDLAVGDRDETCGFHPCGPDGYARRSDAGTFAQAIDHILVKGGEKLAVRSFRRLTDAWFDPVSDHYPLYIDIA